MQTSSPSVDSTSDRTEERSLRISKFRNWSAFEFLIAIVLFIVTSPIVEGLQYGNLIDAILLTFVLASAVVAVANRRSVMIAAFLAVLAIAGRWVHHFRPDSTTTVIYVSAGLLLLAFVFVQYLRYILTARVVTFRVLCAAISSYFMLGMLWGMAYIIISNITPRAFALSGEGGATVPLAGFDAFYFSFVTLSTVGYGDIVPVAKPARMLAAMEATTGTLYVAILIARLVSMHATAESAR